MEEGPYIRLDVDHERSKSPEDGGFGEALDFFENGSRTQEGDSGLAFTLAEISRSKGEEGKEKIISDALYSAGLNWVDFKGIRENPKALQAFGYMIAHWDTPKDGNPKTRKDHMVEAEEFAKLLK